MGKKARYMTEWAPRTRVSDGKESAPIRERKWKMNAQKDVLSTNLKRQSLCQTKGKEKRNANYLKKCKLFKEMQTI